MCMKPSIPPTPVPEVIKPRPETAKDEGTMKRDFRIGNTGKMEARRQGLQQFRLPGNPSTTQQQQKTPGYGK